MTSENTLTLYAHERQVSHFSFQSALGQDARILHTLYIYNTPISVLIRKYPEAAMEKVRSEWEAVMNKLEADFRAMFELANEIISVIVEATFMDGYYAGFEEGKRFLKENHPEIDVSRFEVHDFPMPPGALKDLDDLKEQCLLSWSSFC